MQLETASKPSVCCGEEAELRFFESCCSPSGKEHVPQRENVQQMITDGM